MCQEKKVSMSCVPQQLSCSIWAGLPSQKATLWRSPSRSTATGLGLSTSVSGAAVNRRVRLIGAGEFQGKGDWKEASEIVFSVGQRVLLGKMATHAFPSPPSPPAVPCSHQVLPWKVLVSGSLLEKSVHGVAPLMFAVHFSVAYPNSDLSFQMWQKGKTHQRMRSHIWIESSPRSAGANDLLWWLMVHRNLGLCLEV